MELKRPNQWFLDDTEPVLFPNKKQAVQTLKTSVTPGMLDAGVSSWGHNPGFQPVSNQFVDRLFGSDLTRSARPTESTSFDAGVSRPNIGREYIDKVTQYDSSVGFSAFSASEDPETSLSYDATRKVKVNQANDSRNGLYFAEQHGCDKLTGKRTAEQAYTGMHNSNFISAGQDSSQDGVTFMDHSGSKASSHIRPVGSVLDKIEDNALSMRLNHKGDTSTICFSDLHNDSVSHDLLHNQSSPQTSEAIYGVDLTAANAKVATGAARTAKSRPGSVPKNKVRSKISKKEAPNSFPSNVRSLLSTGMLDGVPMKYVSVSRQELCGIVKGSGYLCGCQSCNFSKVLNAFEFERHAGCRTKHPNNHIYFENGKTIYQIVQELRSAPGSKLFDTIETAFGAPINQKSFRLWKESFQAATRELQRIYGKDEWIIMYILLQYNKLRGCYVLGESGVWISSAFLPFDAFLLWLSTPLDRKRK